MSMRPRWSRLQRVMLEDLKKEMIKAKRRLDQFASGELVPVTVHVKKHVRPRRVVRSYSYTAWRKS